MKVSLAFYGAIAALTRGINKEVQLTGEAAALSQVLEHIYTHHPELKAELAIRRARIAIGDEIVPPQADPMLTDGAILGFLLPTSGG